MDRVVNQATAFAERARSTGTRREVAAAAERVRRGHTIDLPTSLATAAVPVRQLPAGGAAESARLLRAADDVHGILDASSPTFPGVADWAVVALNEPAESKRRMDLVRTIVTHDLRGLVQPADLDDAARAMGLARGNRRWTYEGTDAARRLDLVLRRAATRPGDGSAEAHAAIDAWSGAAAAAHMRAAAIVTRKSEAWGQLYGPLRRGAADDARNAATFAHAEILQAQELADPRVAAMLDAGRTRLASVSGDHNWAENPFLQDHAPDWAAMAKARVDMEVAAQYSEALAGQAEAPAAII